MTALFSFTTVKLDPTEPRFGIGYVEGLPASGPISLRFGGVDQWHPTGHAGNDIAIDRGTPELAPLGGVVVDVFDVTLPPNPAWDARKAIYGNAVIIDHDPGDGRPAYYSIFMHLDQPSHLIEGQRVETGALIGYAGSTGKADGPHCHWGFWPKQTERYPDFPPSGPVGVLLDAFDFCERSVPVPPPSVANLPMARQYLAAVQSALAGLADALGKE